MRQFVSLRPALDGALSLPHSSSGTPGTTGQQAWLQLNALVILAAIAFVCAYWREICQIFAPLCPRKAAAGAIPSKPLESILVISDGGAPKHSRAQHGQSVKGSRGKGKCSLSEGRSRVTNSKVATAKHPYEAPVSSPDLQAKGRAHRFETLIPASDGQGSSPGVVEVVSECSTARSLNENEPTLGAPPSAKEKLLAEQARARLYGKNDAAAVANDSAPVVLPSGPEPAAFDLIYHARDELAALEDDDCNVPNTLAKLKSKQWKEVISGLNMVRQLGIHHSSVLGPMLHEVVPLVVQHVKSLRSSVCKTALLCVSDMTEDFGDALLPLLDSESAASSLLSQLLMKAASKDKKFVIEEAERCLNTVCVTLDATALCPMFIPHLKNKNPKIRASACECLAAVLVRIPDQTLSSVSANGRTALSEVLEPAAPLVSDKMQQAREASRRILLLLRDAFYRLNTDDILSWEGFVAAEIKTPAAASAVLKVTASLPSS